MKKNILYRLYSLIFIGMCIAPAALMPVVRSDASKEKRDLAEFPKVKTEEGKLNFDFFDQFSDYFSDHFAFRQQLVTLDGHMKATVFGTSANSGVIIGKDGWLYYSETADDFLNVNTIDSRGISNIVHNISLMNEFCEDKGVKFLFTVAPNKNSVYPEHMPFNYIESDRKGNYELLFDKLTDDIPHCDMKETLKNTSSNMPLYHKEDTHWNNLGAYAGHAKLMNMLGKEVCPAGNWSIRNDRQGDLAAMVYPADKPDDTQYYTDYQFTYQYQGRFRALDDISIKTLCEGKDGSLLMYRDSYGEAILPFMAECFGAAEFSRSVPYRMDYIESAGIDTVILEIVERNIGNLQKYAPFMQAPERELPDISGAGVCSDIVIEKEDNGQLVHFYGVLGDGFFSGDDAVILVTAGDRTYEAFNCFEDRLLGREGETSSNGFSLYIPKEQMPDTDNIKVTVVRNDGSAVTSS